MPDHLNYKYMKPEKALAHFVESFWMLHNQSGNTKEVVVLPDGRIDLFFSQSATEPFHVTLMGLGTQADEASITAKTLTFAISFKALATEYILHSPVSKLVNAAENLPADFWGFSVKDMSDFETFCKKASGKIQSLIPKEIDSRKQKLFDLIYISNGELSVSELSDKVGWSSRQINRYFSQQYGISLKSYCQVLRFRASFQHIKNGTLSPQLNFVDQSHFIREIKKLSGVLPKDLSRNLNDRFIQFSTLTKT